MVAHSETKNVAIRAALKLDPSLKLWVWGWTTCSDDWKWLDIHPRTYEFYLKHGELLAVSKELPTWVPIEKPSE